MMKQTTAFLLLSLALMMGLQAQKYLTKTGTIDFSSETPMEKIEAKNQQAISVLNTEDGGMAFSVLMKGFNFEKALMQEHFNEKYVESDKFPKAKFNGKITNLDEVDFSTPGEYDVHVKGDMTLHGVTKEVEADGTLVVQDGTIRGYAAFDLVLADFDIKIPKVVKDNIAESVSIVVNANYEPYNK
jgi:polyisoprenoid-binding protein YceI